MKKLIAGLLAGSILAAGAMVPAQADTTQQVQFAKGKSSATIKGTVKGGDEANYVLRANGGQTLNVDLKASKGAAFFSVLPPSGPPALFDGMQDGNHYSGTLPSDGEYKIVVYLKGAAKESGNPVSFTLNVGIPASAKAAGGAAGGASETAAAEKACLAAVAKQVGKSSGSLKVLEASVSEAATVVMVQVPEAAAPWKCFSDRKGKVSGVEFTGSEGAL